MKRAAVWIAGNKLHLYAAESWLSRSIPDMSVGCNK